MNILSIIVTYNRKVLLEECINSLKKQNNVSTDIFVVDNNSTDGTEKMISEKFPDIFYVNTNKNLGGAGGFNYGIKKAFNLKKKYDYFWIMDDDTIPNNNSLYEIMKVVGKDANFGFISPKTIWKDGSLCLMNRQSDLEKKLIDANTRNMTKLKRCTFVACFLNTKAILDVGLPIKEFFIWADDTEYTQRISEKYNCYYAGDSIVVHKMTQNTGVNIENDNFERIDRYFYLFRNKYYIAKKEGIWGYLWYHKYILKNLYNVLVKSKNYRSKRIKIIFKGYFAGCKFNPKIEVIE